MPAFVYTARTATGELKSATIEAANKEDVVNQLKRLRMAVVKVEEQSKTKSTTKGSVAMRDIVIFTRQFSTMINSGLPLVQALDILSKQSENPVLQAVTRQVVFDVESGHTVADALAKHPNAFTELYVNMVAAGEAGGILDTILLRLATFMEKNDALVRKVKGAMIYPGVISGVAGSAISILLLFVIPTFQSMFESVGLALPLPTRIVIMMSEFLQGYWWALIIAGVLAFRGFKSYYATSKGQLVIDRLLLKAPVLGDVLRKTAVSRFTRTLGTLISSGVSILDGLEITAKTAGNRVVENSVMSARERVMAGHTLGERLKDSGVFPPMVVQMVIVGEQTGALDNMLAKVADYYEDEVDVAVSGLTALLEPLLIVFLGVVIGGIVIAIYLPIFKVVTLVK